MSSVAASIVVLTYDRPGRLARCLDSLSAQQYGEPFEIVVADDGSRPATARVVDDAIVIDPRIRHVRGEHRGIPAMRNLGVAAARGRYIAIVADDYVLTPDYLATAIDYLERRPEAAVVRFNIVPSRITWGARISDLYYSSSIWRRLESENVAVADLIDGVATTTLEAAGAAVFHAEVLAAVGPWDEHLQRGEDTEQSARLRAAGYEVHILGARTVLHEYRQLPVDTLRKCFLTGIWRDRLDPLAAPPSRVRHLRRVGGSWLAIDRVRRGGTSRRSFAWFLPWMTLFETAVRAGALYGRLTPNWGSGSASPAAVESPARR